MSTLLNELENNLTTAKEMGDREWQTRLEARIAELTKPPEPKKPAAAAKPATKAKGK